MHLLPLFSFDPALYEDIIATTAFEGKKNQQPMTLKQVRDKWKEFQVHDISTLALAPYKKAHSQFLVDQLVTIQVDNITENFTIQAV